MVFFPVEKKSSCLKNSLNVTLHPCFILHPASTHSHQLQHPLGQRTEENTAQCYRSLQRRTDNGN